MLFLSYEYSLFHLIIKTNIASLHSKCPLSSILYWLIQVMNLFSGHKTGVFKFQFIDKYLTPSSAANFYSNLSLEEQKELFLLKYECISTFFCNVLTCVLGMLIFLETMLQ